MTRPSGPTAASSTTRGPSKKLTRIVPLVERHRPHARRTQPREMRVRTARVAERGGLGLGPVSAAIACRVVTQRHQRDERRDERRADDQRATTAMPARAASDDCQGALGIPCLGD